MKYLITIKLMLIILLLSGCQVALEHSEDKLRDREKILEIADNCHLAAPSRIGVFKGYMGERLDEMPERAVEAVNEILSLSERDPNTLTEYEKSYSVGLWLRFYEATAKEIVKQWFPEILRFWP